MASHRITYLLTLAVCVIFYAYYVGYFSFYLLILIIALPFLSLALSLPSMLGIKASLRVPQSLRRGDNAAAVLEITGRSWLPVAKVRFSITQNMKLINEKKKTNMACYAFTKASVEFAISTEHCQEIELSVDKIRVSDYLDLFSFSLASSQKISAVVMPLPVPPAPEPELPPEIQNSSMLRPKRGGGFSEEHDLREYREGDSIRAVHWKLSSKREELIVREPLVPDRLELVITADFPSDISARDAVLDNLMWLSQGLLRHELVHIVRWMDSDNNSNSRTVDCENAIDSLLTELISLDCGYSGSQSSFGLGKNGDWHFHLPVISKGVAW